MNRVDLHVHSTKSDGTFTPTQLVDYALEKELTAFALTDHDTTDGLDEAISYAAGKPVEVIPGIEFSTEYEGKDIHIVGLYLHYKERSFQEKIQSFVDSRIRRNLKMCRNLQEAGIDITYEKLCEEHPDAVITRAHYAVYLKDHGYVTSYADAFAQYVGDHCKYFVPREKITPSQAVGLILQNGGVPVLAHPPLYHMGKDRLDTLVCTLKQAGLAGIETIYSTYERQDERDMFRLAKKYDLLPSGGSDFHGANKPGLDLAVGYGKLFVPEEIRDNLRKAARP
ncbi:MAG: PHP domain-containing protein [Blautia sp.]|nr:PHP domain-containing protein [Blautia sp.]MCM1202208.1 PHP domain-containing protein [Bacteroides fragilis]